MTAKKRVTSIICIISLILAITAGVLLSVGAQPVNNYYGGESVNFSNTAVTINAQSSTKSVEDTPEGAVEIPDAATLQAFINGVSSYSYTYEENGETKNGVKDCSVNVGFLTKDFTFDWANKVGSQAYLSAGRTIDGNGHTVTLADADATANVSNKTGDGAKLSGTAGVVQGYDESKTAYTTDPLDNSSNYSKRNYGMLVDYNMGTIKNIKFVYSQAAHSVANNKNYLGKNFAGIVCGSNSGTITNCDLTVTGGEFGYFYCDGTLSTGDYSVGGVAKETFRTYFGGIAGRNGGEISFITAKYSGSFNAKLNTRAQNSDNSGWFGSTAQQNADAVSEAGGIAGTMSSRSSKCTNIIIQADSSVSYTLKAQRNNKTLEKASAATLVAAVVPANSAFSFAVNGIGESEAEQATVSNIIVDFKATNSGLVISDAKKEAIHKASANAVVYCGKATDVTIFSTSGQYDHNVDHCGGCLDGTQGAQHGIAYGNLVLCDDYADVTVGFADNGDQVITADLKDKTSTDRMLGGFDFTKYNGKDADNNGIVQADTVDTINNGVTYICYNDEERFDQSTYTIAPYQDASQKYWVTDVRTYEVTTISYVGEPEYTYNGEDFLAKQFKFAKGDGVYAVPSGFNAVNPQDVPVLSGRLPGTYTFALQAKDDSDLAYVDNANKVVVYYDATAHNVEHSFEVIKAEVTPINASWLADNWLTAPQNFEFSVQDGIKGAADGYVYEVNGDTNSVSGLIMENKVDTPKAGRKYTVYLTSGGVQVTEPYIYTVKIDMTKPTAKVDYEHPIENGTYYTHNKVFIDAKDSASGVASIEMFNNDAKVADIMTDENKNDDGTYSWKFETSGKNEIVVTDVAGNSTTIELEVNIDKTTPTISVEAYYYTEGDTGEIGGDGNPEQGRVKTTYESGTPATSAVYFKP
ncbi:MAG: hypothetical protein K2I23_06645, partial [Clostridia bacterium]|nr:hypothetical protein [Clostridia bacterium]